ncbi:hypothetical protein CYLTODRAFT_459628, partial [Cylindrobasidium torrendii FP15055 ss-10]
QPPVSLPDDDAPSTPPVAGPSRQPDNPVNVDTESQTVIQPFDFRFPPENTLDPVAGPSQPPTIAPPNGTARGGGGRGGSRDAGRGRGGSSRADGPSQPAATGSGNIARRGNRARRGRGQPATRFSARQVAIQEKKRKAPDSAADKGYEMPKKKRRA